MAERPRPPSIIHAYSRDKDKHKHVLLDDNGKTTYVPTTDVTQLLVETIAMLKEQTRKHCVRAEVAENNAKREAAEKVKVTSELKRKLARVTKNAEEQSRELTEARVALTGVRGEIATLKRCRDTGGGGGAAKKKKGLICSKCAAWLALNRKSVSPYNFDSGENSCSHVADIFGNPTLAERVCKCGSGPGPCDHVSYIHVGLKLPPVAVDMHRQGLLERGQFHGTTKEKCLEIIAGGGLLGSGEVSIQTGRTVVADNTSKKTVVPGRVFTSRVYEYAALELYSHTSVIDEYFVSLVLEVAMLKGPAAHTCFTQGQTMGMDNYATREEQRAAFPDLDNVETVHSKSNRLYPMGVIVRVAKVGRDCQLGARFIPNDPFAPHHSITVQNKNPGIVVDKKQIFSLMQSPNEHTIVLPASVTTIRKTLGITGSYNTYLGYVRGANTNMVRIETDTCLRKCRQYFEGLAPNRLNAHLFVYRVKAV